MGANAKKIKKLSDQYHPQLVEIRRYLHRNPELSYQEFETTKYIAGILEDLDIEVDRPLETGCIGVLQGDNASDKVVALRADIDALAIQEKGKHKEEFISQFPGVAHCCGHDSHTANLLGAAKILSELRDSIEGTVLLIFQPGEEKLPGGARLLCETGYLQEKGVDVVYGLHTNPMMEPGQVGVRSGPTMARPDEFRIEIRGNGGHAAIPQNTVDPIVLASQVVNSFQTIISRNVNPTEPAVLTVGQITGGTTHNIIPEHVHMIGTVRTFSEDTTELIRSRMEQILKGITRSAGGDFTLEFNYGYPAVINTDWAAGRVRDVAEQVTGKENVVSVEEPIMAGEDFAFYQEHFPGAFFFLGSGSEQAGSLYSWHHPKYNVDEECLRTGAAMMASLAFQPVS